MYCVFRRTKVYVILKYSVAIYIGIRYAKAPVGDLRFRRPEEFPGWTGVVNATKLGVACPQLDVLGTGKARYKVLTATIRVLVFHSSK